MKKLVSIVRLDFLPEKPDLALLLLRLWFGGAMLILHGWPKLSNFKQTSQQIPDFFGIGKTATAGLAVFGEVVCPLLLIFGFFTRFGALGAAITMGVAFFLAHEGALKGGNSGELAFMYLAGYLAILIAGPGKYSVDGGGKGGGGARKAKPAKE
jgi:putative oxidoreductase